VTAEFSTATEAIQKLDAMVLALPLPQGIATSLTAKLNVEKVLGDLNAHNDIAAVNRLRAFINAVKAQGGKQIGTADANALIAYAQATIDAIKAGMVTPASTAEASSAWIDADAHLFLPAVAR
jgi:hypothetical protein